MKKIVILTYLFMFANILFAESAPDTLWTRTFGGSGDDKAYSVQQTADGGYIMVGRTHSYGSGDYDAWLIKTDANGDSLWSKTFGDYYIDEAYVVKQTSDGGYIVGGMSTQFGWAGEGWIIRTDAQGNLLWQNGYHADGTTTSDWDYIYDLIETDDGGYIAAGFTGMNTYSHQGWVIKVNANGNLIWNKHYGLATYWDRLFKIRPAGDGNYILAGDKHVSYSGIYKHDGWLLKIEADGDSLWSATFGGSEHDLFRALCVNDDGSIIAGGQTQSYGTVGYEGWLVKTDASGNPIWNKTYGSGFLSAVIETPDHRNVAGGGIFCPATANDAWLFSTNGDGEVCWDELICASDLDDIIDSMERTSDGGYILGGRTNAHATDGDFWLAKTGPDYLSVPGEINDAQVTLSNFPNPVTHTTKIQYSIKNSLHINPVEILIYNIKGQLVDSVEGRNGAAIWDTQIHTNGIYYYKVDLEKITSINKMIVIH